MDGVVSKRTVWLKIGVVAGFCHLILVTCGAADIELPTKFFLGKVINYYGELSGASYGYSFFAPGVTSQIRAVFDVVDRDFHHSTLELLDDTNREIKLRIGDIIEQFSNEDQDDQMKFQRSLSASLSGTVFARYPGAKSVTIRLEGFTPISMEEYRKGARPAWIQLYSAEFINSQDSRKK
jgi:hypothetical protein